MHDALRMNDDLHAAHLDVEQPACFDHLQPFVEQRRRINRDFSAHDPGRMLERAFESDVREVLLRRLPERTARGRKPKLAHGGRRFAEGGRSEEHTSELQSHSDLVCRLLLEKKKSRRSPTSARRAESTTIVLTRVGVRYWFEAKHLTNKDRPSALTWRTRCRYSRELQTNCCV